MAQSFDTFAVDEKGRRFNIVIVLAIFAFVGTIGAFAGLHLLENDRAIKECREWTVKILHGAKEDKLEHGIYEATLPTNDPWDTAYASNLTVDEFSNVAIVSSAGRDMKFGTHDDVNIERTDLHKRKIIGTTLKAAGRAIGKSLAHGAMDAAKEKAADTKNKLMGHFKKKKNDGDD